MQVINHQHRSVRARRGAEILGCGVSTYWRYAKRPDFPKSKKLSPRLTIWDEGELIAWRDAQGGGK